MAAIDSLMLLRFQQCITAIIIYVGNSFAKGGHTREQKVTQVRECDRRSVANMFAIVYTLLVAVERHDHIQFSFGSADIGYYNMQSIKYIRLLKWGFLLEKLQSNVINYRLYVGYWDEANMCTIFHCNLKFVIILYEFEFIIRNISKKKEQWDIKSYEYGNASNINLNMISLPNKDEQHDYILCSAITITTSVALHVLVEHAELHVQKNDSVYTYLKPGSDRSSLPLPPLPPKRQQIANSELQKE